MDFQVKRDDLHRCRFDHTGLGEGDGTVGEGDAVLRVDRFGLTSNNITYCVFGDAMSYWDFFPAPEGWGHMPVWGFGEVASWPDGEVDEGTRVYGYFPPASRLAIVPDRVNERGFVDAAPHREPLPSAYHAFRRTDSDPIYEADMEDEQILFWPLFYTSLMLDDQLADEDFGGADTLVLSSASSKTALIAAYLLAQRENAPELIALTSQGNREFVEGLGIYDATVDYDEIDQLPGDRAAYADFSGDGKVRFDVHSHYGDRLAASTAVGMTHWDQMAARGDGSLPGPKPKFFFAPDRIRKRGEDWGTAKLEENVAAAWTPFAEWAGGWLQVEQISGEDEIKRVYLELLDGKIDPRVGHVVQMES
jgi:hypothetical protein